jgi:predicted protein tyrosine phosphatase
MNEVGPPFFRVTICGIGELDQHGEAGVTHVLSILDPDWPEPAAFLAFPPHRRLELRFHDIIEPSPRCILPAEEHVDGLLAFGREAVAAGPDVHLLIHCHAGISRSTAATALLLAQAQPSLPPDAIFAEIFRLRPRAWPNLRLLEFGDRALGRDGALVAAVAAQYRRVMAVDPPFARFISEVGRGCEVALAEAG